MRARLTLLSGLVIASVAITGSAPAPAASTPSRVLTLTGIGPLKLGMKRSDAVATGWLTNRGTGCKLGGAPYPITYKVAGSKAPSGVAGVVEFQRDRLTNLSFTKGVHTPLGVTVAKTTLKRMTTVYRAAGYKVFAPPFDNTFGGTFVHVMRGADIILGGFGPGKVVAQLALPRVPVCE